MDEAASLSAASAAANHDGRGPTTRAAEGLPRRRFTVVEVEAMAAMGLMRDEERVELIGGELVPMSPKGSHHETVKIALLRHWYRAAPDAVEVAPETTLRLAIDTYLEPDVILFDRAGGLSGLTATNAHLVVEIADSSLRYDIGRKAALYAAFGVRELWVIDAVRGTTRMFRSPTASGYEEMSDVAADAVATPLFAPGAFALCLKDLGLSGQQ